MADNFRAYMTPSRLKWLRHVRDNGESFRSGFGNQPCYCVRFGWTEWVDIDNGDYRERLTDLGRQVLEAWENGNG